MVLYHEAAFIVLANLQGLSAPKPPTTAGSPVQAQIRSQHTDSHNSGRTLNPRSGRSTCNDSKVRFQPFTSLLNSQE